MNRLRLTAVLLTISALAAGCAPEVGSQRWCDKMEDTPRGDWSANDALDYARYCILDGDE